MEERCPSHSDGCGGQQDGHVMEESHSLGLERSLDHSAGRDEISGVLAKRFRAGAPW